MAGRERQDRRREPRFDDAASDAPDRLDLRLTPDDRPTGSSRRARTRPAPERYNDSYDEPPAPRRGRGGDREPPEPPRGRARKRPRRSLFGRLIYWGVVASIWGVIGVVGILAYYAAQLPPKSEWAVPKRPPNVSIVAVDGTILGNRGETGGEFVRFEQLPPHLAEAVMAIEDRRFRSHFGIDPLGLARAVVVNVTTGSLVQGGSTLTQQLAKNLFLTPDRTFGRKVQELVLAFWLEHDFTKDEILEMYLNRVYFGAGAYGVDAAARRYFGKSARQLTLMESATLAGLLKAPSRFSPARDRDRARERAETVLAAMVEAGFIKEGERREALAAPAVPVHRHNTGSENYVSDWVMDLVPAFTGSIDEDITVVTTIDPNMQLLAEAALQYGLAQYGEKKDVSQGAIVALAPDGSVKALVGGIDYATSQFNRAVQAKRQPGSSFKPFVYLAALERGLTPDTVRVDKPTRIGNWTPQNYSKEFRGPVSLRTALALSLNTVAAQLAAEVGPRQVSTVAQRLGITSPLERNASIALGTSVVTPLEIATAYVPFSNGGRGVVPHVIASIKTASGKTIYARPATQTGLGQVIAPVHVAQMVDMMEETLSTGTGKKAQIPGWQAGGKTGTSQDFRDAWFIGFTGALTTAVWFGNDDNSPTNQASGGTLAATVWQKFMADAHRDWRPFGIPGAVPRAPRLGPDGVPVAGTGGGAVASETTARIDRTTTNPAERIQPNANQSLDDFFKKLFGG